MATAVKKYSRKHNFPFDHQPTPDEIANIKARFGMASNVKRGQKGNSKTIKYDPEKKQLTINEVVVSTVGAERPAWIDFADLKKKFEDTKPWEGGPVTNVSLENGGVGRSNISEIMRRQIGDQPEVKLSGSDAAMDEPDFVSDREEAPAPPQPQVDRTKHLKSLDQLTSEAKAYVEAHKPQPIHLKVTENGLERVRPDDAAKTAEPPKQDEQDDPETKMIEEDVEAREIENQKLLLKFRKYQKLKQRLNQANVNTSKIDQELNRIKKCFGGDIANVDLSGGDGGGFGSLFSFGNIAMLLGLAIGASLIGKIATGSVPARVPQAPQRTSSNIDGLFRGGANLFD